MSGCGSSSEASRTTTSARGAVRLGPAFGSMTQLPGVLTTRPPWPANSAKLQLRLRKIGLPALTQEGQVLHIHQHLDLFVNGRRVTVPANIGIDASGAFLSPLHTHDTTGIIHVESPTVASFSLGQFFAVWGVRLDRSCIGGSCAGAGKRLRAWVNGRAVNADPTRIVLDRHQEIVLAYGTPAQMPKPVPSTYRFPAGL
jgi:hypothetical protein